MPIRSSSRGSIHMSLRFLIHATPTSRRADEQRQQLRERETAALLNCGETFAWSLHHTAGVVARRQSMPDPKAPKTQNPKPKKAKANKSCAAAAPAVTATTMRRKTCFFDSNKYLPLHSRLLFLLLLLSFICFSSSSCYFFLCKLQK